MIVRPLLRQSVEHQTQVLVALHHDILVITANETAAITSEAVQKISQ